jgi:hypothetical protein
MYEQEFARLKLQMPEKTAKAIATQRSMIRLGMKQDEDEMREEMREMQEDMEEDRREMEEEMEEDRREMEEDMAMMRAFGPFWNGY